MLGQNKEAGAVIGVILDFPGNNLHSVDFGSPGAGDSGAIGDSHLFYHFNAAGRIISRY